MIHLEATPEIKVMAQKAFPSYTGRTFKLDNSGRPISLVSHWSGGSRDYYVVLQLGSNDTKAIPQNGTMFDTVNVEPISVPPGFLIVEHSIFCGKDMGITFHVNPETALTFLPEPVSLTDAERLVLTLTRNLKASYDGRKPRVDEAIRQGMSKANFEATQETLKIKGLLNKAGAITISGKNAIS